MMRMELIGAPIVVGVDESETAQRALRAAIDLASALGHDLVVVSAFQPQRQSELMAVHRDAPPDVLWRLQPNSAVQLLLDEAREQAEAAGVAVECVARKGAAADVTERCPESLGERWRALPARPWPAGSSRSPHSVSSSATRPARTAGWSSTTSVRAGLSATRKPGDCALSRRLAATSEGGGRPPPRCPLGGEPWPVDLPSAAIHRNAAG